MLAAVFSAPTARAGLFDDDEARRAILDIRAKIDAVNTRVDGKADKTTSLSLSDQNDRLNQELAKLRGQIEVLTNELANTQQRQKDFYVDLDTRLRKLEPQKVSVDGQEVNIGANDQKAYDAALATFKSADYKTAVTAFSNFVRSSPDSGLTPSAQYWLGNAYYALRDYKNAIAAQQVVVSKYADNPKAADALLNISSSYTELKNKPQAKRALEQLLSQYPNAPSAQTAKERLDAMK
ncbi:MAG: tol-pal system protein YbgF [Collimonas sp.]|uniref:tol-pal system protein YbgF n=1 Tax=Collimonas sp. TaxID=1963772 RepID=UPI0032644D3D